MKIEIIKLIIILPIFYFCTLDRNVEKVYIKIKSKRGKKYEKAENRWESNTHTHTHTQVKYNLIE